MGLIKDIVLTFKRSHPNAQGQKPTDAGLEPTTRSTATHKNKQSDTPQTAYIFAPYLMLETDTGNLIGTHSDWLTVAFVMGYKDGQIRWDAQPDNEHDLHEKLRRLHKGKLIISFGGASAGNQKEDPDTFCDVAGQHKHVDSLAHAYEAIADKLHSTYLDMDVEGEAARDKESIDRRHKALALLQKRRKDIKVHFTVPVGLEGLSTHIKEMLLDAKRQGVRISVVNLMTMYMCDDEYMARRIASSSNNKLHHTMYDAVIEAVKAAKPFIKKQIGAKIGITPQIGCNPDAPYTCENFTAEDAHKLMKYAAKHDDVALVSYWNLNNDVKKEGCKFCKCLKCT